MSSEHTKAFRVRRAAKELIIAEADLMEIRLYSDDRENYEVEEARLRVVESDIIDFTHAQLHQLNDTLQGRLTEPGVIPIGKAMYAVIRNGKIHRYVEAVGAKAAYKELKPQAGEELFIKVGDE